jgi:RNA polymerase sigma-70 factor (ECF subfamily)
MAGAALSETAQSTAWTMTPPGDDADEDALVRAAQRGDGDAFAALVSRHKSRVFGIAARFARGTHDLEDLAQDIFVRVFQKLDRFRGEAPFSHWLSRLAVRRCWDHLRRTKFRRDEAPLEAVEFTVRDESIEREAEARIAHEVVMRAMAELPPDMRLVLTLLELDDRSVRDVAALTGWSEANVKTRGSRARARLKEILEAQRDE